MIEKKKSIKWNIQINQKAIIDNQLNINLIDATIFDFIYNFIASDNAEKIIKEEKTYYWISYQYIIDALPLLEINNKRTISRHIQKLIDCNLLDQIIIKEYNNKTFFCIGKKAKFLFFDNDSIENDIPKEIPMDSKVHAYVPESTNSMDSKVHTLCTEKYNNSYINDTNINSFINIHKQQKTSYRENVLLSEKEYNTLVEKYGLDDTNKILDKLHFAKLAKGYKYKSDYGAINQWVIDALHLIENKKNTKLEVII